MLGPHAHGLLYAPAPVSSLATSQLPPEADFTKPGNERLARLDRRANSLLRWLALAGGLLLFLALIAIVYQVLSGASGAFDKYGIGFLAHKTWVPPAAEFGAWTFIYGTLVTGLCSLFLATLLGIAIGLFLSLMAPRGVATIVGPLVEMLAAIPSVVLGLIGIYLICPFIKTDIEPWVH
jgi:phosphate transport system permease protein